MRMAFVIWRGRATKTYSGDVTLREFKRQSSSHARCTEVGRNNAVYRVHVDSEFRRRSRRFTGAAPWMDASALASHLMNPGRQAQQGPIVSLHNMTGRER